VFISAARIGEAGIFKGIHFAFFSSTIPQSGNSDVLNPLYKDFSFILEIL
jgi:hypothetical protein